MWEKAAPKRLHSPVTTERKPAHQIHTTEKVKPLCIFLLVGSPSRQPVDFFVCLTTKKVVLPYIYSGFDTSGHWNTYIVWRRYRRRVISMRECVCAPKNQHFYLTTIWFWFAHWDHIWAHLHSADTAFCQKAPLESKKENQASPYMTGTAS